MLRASLEQLRMFSALAELGTYQQAAQAVFKTPSSVHHAIAKLEDELGVQLFQVQGRQSHLTHQGRLLLRRAKHLLAEADQVQQVADTLSRGIETSLCLAIDQAFPSKQLYPVVDELSRRHPLIRLEFHETVLSGAIDQLRCGEADIAIGPQAMPGALNEQICSTQLIAVASPSHPLCLLTRELSQQDLVSQRQIVLRDTTQQTKIDQGWLGSEQRWTVSHVRTSIDLVLQGLGFAWLPEPSINEHLDNGSLRRLSIGAAGIRNLPFYLNFRDADALGPVARDFLAAVRQIVA